MTNHKSTIAPIGTVKEKNMTFITWSKNKCRFKVEKYSRIIENIERNILQDLKGLGKNVLGSTKIQTRSMNSICETKIEFIIPPFESSQVKRLFARPFIIMSESLQQKNELGWWNSLERFFLEYSNVIQMQQKSRLHFAISFTKIRIILR